jgi:hypothetical protein
MTAVRVGAALFVQRRVALRYFLYRRDLRGAMPHKR